jgi:hypothetical protein
MKVIDNILLEWAYRCPDGIVNINDPAKKAILDQILKENNIDKIELNEAEADKIKVGSKVAVIKYGPGVVVDINDDFEEYTVKLLSNKKEVTVPFKNVQLRQSPAEEKGQEIATLDSFENFILDKYAVPGQKISGLNNLYYAILSSPQKERLLELIKKSGNKKLTPGKTSISDIDNELFNLIMSYIKLDNGDASELWFAIMFNGKAKGGVASEEGIESDVEVGNQGVSIKNYKKIGNIDFGALPKNELKELKIITNLLVILTGAEFTAGLTRNSLNKLLKILNSESFQEDLKQILEIGKDTQIKALKNIYDRIITLLPNGNTEELVDTFVEDINKLIANKIKKVQWWAVIIGKNDLYLEPSSVIANRITSKEGQLSPVVNQIKGNNLFVNGNLLFNKEEE